MAKGNLPACFAAVFGHEGGYTKDSRDPGNWTGGKVGSGTLKGTKYGVAAASYPNLDIVNLTLDKAHNIYQANYWIPVRGDDLMAGVDLSVFDYAINSGPSRAAKDVQRVVKAKVDGRIGPETLKCIIMFGGKETIQALCATRLSFMRSLKIWETFKRGWSRRVAEVEAKSVAMFLAAGGALSVEARKELEAEGVKAKDKAAKLDAGSGGAVGSGTAVGGGDALLNGELNVVLVVGLVIVVALVVGAIVIKSRQAKDRAAAYLKVAVV